MQAIKFWFILVVWIAGIPVCFSQEKDHNKKKGVADSKAAPVVGKTNKPAPLTLSQLLDRLAKVNSAKEKAAICYELSRLYTSRLKIDSSLYYAEKIKAYSETAGYAQGTGKYHLARSSALYYRVASRQEAMEHITKALNIFIAQKNDQFTGISYRQLAMLFDVDSLSGISSVKSAYWQSIEYLKKTDDIQSLERSYYLLGRLYLHASVFDSAAEYTIKALQLGEVLEDANKVFYSSYNLGEVFLELKDYSKSHYYFEYALRNRAESTDKMAVRLVLANNAICLIMLQQFEGAASAISRFEQMVSGSQASWGMIMVNGLKGNFEYEKGNYAVSRRFLKDAYTNIAVISNAYQHVKYILLVLGKTESKLGNHAEAILYFREVANLALRGRSYQHLLEAFHFLSESFSATNQPDSALYYFRSYAQLKDSLLAIKRQEIVLSVSEKYEAEKKAHQIELLEKEKLLFDYELRMKNEEIENQSLSSIKDAQQIELLAKQNEISRLNASEKALALENREKEIEEKKKELMLMGKEKELQRVIAGKAGQQRKFALLTTLGILLVSVYGYFRYRQNKKLGQQLALSLEELKQAQEQLIRIEREKEAENVRSRISRDIHDEVGATLSGVALFSQIAKQKMEQHRQEDAREYLEHISANSKEMVEKMSDIVWAINPQNDNLDRLVSKLRAYAVNLCAGKGIHFHLHVDESVLSHIPSMQDRKNIYLLVKEAINNAVKYSGGTNIWLRLEKESEAVLLMVKDDGNGFDKSVTASGNGLANMQVRAKELDAMLTIDAQPGRGTVIQLRLDFHPAGGQQPIV